MDDNTNSPFDPDTFLNSVVKDPMATQWSLIDEGTWAFHIKAIELKGTKNPNTILLNLVVDSIDPVLDEVMTRKLVDKRLTMFLNVEGSTILVGRDQNIELGKLRDALGQNNTDDWTLPRLVGNDVKIEIKHFRQKDRDQKQERLVNFYSVTD